MNIILKIGVDMDEVVWGMLEKILPLYNQKYNDSLELKDIKQYDLRSFLKPECKNLFEEFADDCLIQSLDMAPGATEALDELNKRYEVYFVTAGHPYTMRARDDWLQTHLPFYKSKQLIGCCNKQLLDLDVLIDDYEYNLIEGKYFGLLFHKEWNGHVPTQIYNIKRIFSWAEVPTIIADLAKQRARGF